MDTGAIAWKEKGNCYFKQSRYEEALRCYSEAVQIEPLYADAWYNLGMTCRALGYANEAVTCFERAKNYRTEVTRGPNSQIPGLSQSSVGNQPFTRQGLPDTEKK